MSKSWSEHILKVLFMVGISDDASVHDQLPEETSEVIFPNEWKVSGGFPEKWDGKINLSATGLQSWRHKEQIEPISWPLQMNFVQLKKCL